MVLLDTHIWLWLLFGSDRISKSAREHFRQLSADKKLCLSAISVWEASRLVAKQKIKLTMPFDHWIRSATSADFIQLIPVNVEAIIAEHELPESVSGDPSDRIIVATAIANGYELASLDKNLRSLRRVKHYSRTLD